MEPPQGKRRVAATCYIYGTLIDSRFTAEWRIHKSDDFDVMLDPVGVC